MLPVLIIAISHRVFHYLILILMLFVVLACIVITPFYVRYAPLIAKIKQAP